ncbi:outer membrane homotrimeric porin [Desulfovibrio sp. OttesenSCG-928-C06]|nr:outer membrane homotrimeric porin [Desulfovibrio sp. OttesenSCG-928-C06]
MKRLTTLLMALCMVMGTAAMASALEVQVSGVWDTSFRFNDNLGFSEEDENDHFDARSRFRPQIEFIASENLRGVLQLQIGSIGWGDEKQGGALDTTSTSATVRRAYIDWNVADTSLNFKIGLQNLSFPSATRGNPFFGANVAGIIGTVGFTDEVSMNAFWARPFRNTDADKLKDNDMDLFGLVLDVNMDSFSISPWFAYASIGGQSGYWEYFNNYTWGTSSSAGAYGAKGNTDVYATGLALKLVPVENLTIGLDAMYAKMDNDEYSKDNFGSRYYAIEGDGYYMALTVDYAMDWGTPGIFAWYSSGDSNSDQRNAKFGRMPSLGFDNGVAMTRMGFMGSYGHGMDSVVTATGTGTWGVGLQIADVSFVEKLSHTARVAYYEGTNAKSEPSDWLVGAFGDSIYLTKEDYAFEVNFDTQYQIYENFTAVLELGWIYMDLDNKTFEYRKRQPDGVDENAYNANLILRYAF